MFSAWSGQIFDSLFINNAVTVIFVLCGIETKCCYRYFCIMWYRDKIFIIARNIIHKKCNDNQIQLDYWSFLFTSYQSYNNAL